MPLIWMGGEDIDWAGPVDTGAYYRTGFARGCVYAKMTGVTNSYPFPGVTSGWFSLQGRLSNLLAGYKYVGISKFGTNGKGFFIGGGSVIGKVALYSYDSSTVTQLAEESGTSFPSNVITKIDIQLISYGVSGTINVFINGTQVITYTGNLSISGVSDIDCFGLWYNTTSSIYASEFLVATEDTRLSSVVTHAPNGAGDLNQWSGTYANIDEFINSDSDTIYTATADQEFNCSTTNTPAGNFICKGFRVAARAADGTGGVALKTGIRTNSTTDLGDPVTLQGAWQTVDKIYLQNPITANRFTIAELDAIQIAHKSAAV